MKLRGFSLLELLITMLIIGILSTVAVPSYQRYIRRARYQEIIQMALTFQLAVEECYQLYNDLNYCQAGQNNIPDPYHQQKSGIISSIDVQNGVIKVIPQNYQGILTEDSYILTPVIGPLQQLKWEKSGEAVKKGYVP